MLKISFAFFCIGCSLHGGHAEISIEQVQRNEATEAVSFRSSSLSREKRDRFHPPEVFTTLLQALNQARAFKPSGLRMQYTIANPTWNYPGHSVPVMTARRGTVDFSRRVLIGLAAAALAPFPSTPAAALNFKNITNPYYQYEFVVPAGWEDQTKLIKSFEHEVIWGAKGMKLGLSIQPVKANSTEEIGDLEKAAKGIVDFERERNGVEEVTFLGSRAEPGNPSLNQPGYYVVQYLTKSTRGDKYTDTKFCIVNKKLYSLQSEVKQSLYEKDPIIADTVKQMLDSFHFN